MQQAPASDLVSQHPLVYSEIKLGKKEQTLSPSMLPRYTVILDCHALNQSMQQSSLYLNRTAKAVPSNLHAWGFKVLGKPARHLHAPIALCDVCNVH